MFLVLIIFWLVSSLPRMYPQHQTLAVTCAFKDVPRRVVQNS